MSTGVVIPATGFTPVVVAEFTWDESTTSPQASVPRTVTNVILDNLYNKMRGCVLNPDRTVNYYLNENNWALKEDGTPSNLTGADGNVMVEIPHYYFMEEKVGNETTWTISPDNLPELSIHPGFILDGQEEEYRYMGAYDGCVKKADGSFIGGLNLDNNTGRVSTSADQLASVKGQYPMVGLTRNEFRILAANIGDKWRQLDFPLWSAIQMLYLVEYQTFFAQDVLGNGNTNNSYSGSSANQNNSPHTIAGFRDDVGNGSTTPANGQGAATKPGTVAMKYRGIENLYGNGWTWADGINLNVPVAGNVHIVSGNFRENYIDDTAVGHDLITSDYPTESGNIRNLFSNKGGYFLARTLGGTNAQYVTDISSGHASTDRLILVGGGSGSGSSAGVFALFGSSASWFSNRTRGGRLSC